MASILGEGFGALMAASAMLAGVDVGAASPVTPSDEFPIVELRQYTLVKGQRDVLIDLFEREFVETQEAVGLKVIGTFIDLDNPDKFVWVRGFKDMDARLAGLSAFYGGPAWKAHREAANATMIDSDNVLLLKAPASQAQFTLPAERPTIGASAPAGLVTATIYYLDGSTSEAGSMFAEKIAPQLAQQGAAPLAWFLTNEAPNNFPRLPVREGEQVLIWFAAFADEADRLAHHAAFQQAKTALAPMLSREPETLRLKPTSRSLIRGGVRTSNEVNGFDFLHGDWRVTHRRLRQRGIGSHDWSQFSGTAQVRPLLGGLCNVEEHVIPGEEFSGITLRCFDRTTARWSIYWVSQRDGVLQPPVHGNFFGSEGRFEGDDHDGGRPIRVRFVWRSQGPNSARWEQSFSYDNGSTWESNWAMEFERQ